jgi:hypothetical protein
MACEKTILSLFLKQQRLIYMDSVEETPRTTEEILEVADGHVTDERVKPRVTLRRQIFKTFGKYNQSKPLLTLYNRESAIFQTRMKLHLFYNAEKFRLLSSPLLYSLPSYYLLLPFLLVPYHNIKNNYQSGCKKSHFTL